MIPKNKFKRIYKIISVLIAGIFLWQQTAWADGAALGEKLKTANTPAGSMSSAQLSTQQTAAQSAVLSQQAIENFSTNNVGPHRLVPISVGWQPFPTPHPPRNPLPPGLKIAPPLLNKPQNPSKKPNGDAKKEGEKKEGDKGKKDDKDKDKGKGKEDKPKPPEKKPERDIREDKNHEHFDKKTKKDEPEHWHYRDYNWNPKTGRWEPGKWRYGGPGNAPSS